MGQMAAGVQTIANTPEGKVVRVVATELTPIGDISRIIYGVDPYTGESLSGAERTIQSGVFLATLGMGDVLKAGNNLLGAPFSTNSVNSLETVFKGAKSLKDIDQGVDKVFEVKK